MEKKEEEWGIFNIFLLQKVIKLFTLGPGGKIFLRKEIWGKEIDLGFRKLEKRKSEKEQ